MLDSIISNFILQSQIQSITTKSSDTGCSSINIITCILEQFTGLAFNNLRLLLVAAV